MTDFDEQLKNAIARGRRTRDNEGQHAASEASSGEAQRMRHSELRLELCEHIEACLRKLCDHFPGFEYSTIVGDEGWGSRISRDNIALHRGVSRNQYSRLEMVIRPFSADAGILELVTKGTVSNRESLNRTTFRFLREAEADLFRKTIDSQVMEFAEQYSAHS